MFPEYLPDLDVFMCPSWIGGADVLETWDRGKTVSPYWTNVPGFSGNDMLELCEPVVEPYYYYGHALTGQMFVVEQDFDDFETAILGYVAGLADEFLTNGPAGATAFADDDWEFEDESGTPLTVHDYTTSFRLREGIERFFITDINNAGASVEAQSEIVMMHDAVSEESTHFNHVPGGSNVLYLDGHVDFIKWVANGEITNPFPVNGAGILLHEVPEILEEAK
jgi:prepilin-type processing-associated H-X9-DG protein